MTASHLRLVHSADADVIPLPRTAMQRDPLTHHVLRLIPQHAITRHGEHITLTGQTAPLAVRVGLSQATRDGLADWMPTGSPGTDVARLTEPGIARLAEWNHTHPERPTTGGDAA